MEEHGASLSGYKRALMLGQNGYLLAKIAGAPDTRKLASLGTNAGLRGCLSAVLLVIADEVTEVRNTHCRHNFLHRKEGVFNQLFRFPQSEDFDVLRGRHA
jgi:hypothetical protein